MIVFARTDVGKIRDINQDYYYKSEIDDEIKLYILADGMGGYKGGEIASNLAVNSAKNYIITNFSSANNNKEEIQELIRSAIEYANMVIHEKSKELKELEGMGTTLEICLFYNNKIFIGHIGDSRIYRIRKNIIRKLTTDHSYVQELLKDGKITKEEARNHPKKNMLVKALGCAPYADPDILIKGFLKGDIIVITSDGLYNALRDEDIYDIVTKNKIDPEIKLINKANENGGYDNITAIIIEND